MKFWPLLILLFLTFALRLFKLEELFYFTYDEEIPAFVARRLILWQHIPLIGGVTPFGFHLGPYFYWFYTVLLSISNLNPLIWGVAGAAIASITTFLAYKTGEILDSKKVGFLSAAFWAFSYLANVYDRHMWALYWGPLISLITLISLIKIVQGKEKFVFLLGATLALGVHADPSNLVFLLLTIVTLLIYKLPFKKNTIIAVGLVLLSFMPLVIFDIRHNFANTKPVIDFVKQGKNSPGFESQKFIENSLLFPQVVSRLFYTFSDHEITKQYSYCQNYIKEKFQAIPIYIVLFSSIMIFTFILWSFKKQAKSSQWQILSMLILLYFFGIHVYGTIFRADIFEHYITGLFTTFLIILAKMISLLPRNLWLVVLAAFVAANLYKLNLFQNSMGLTNKIKAIEFTMKQIGDEPFSLDSLSTCWKYNGYRYLFAVFGREPVKSYVDPNFGYLYGTTQIAANHPQTVIAFVTHDFAPETDDFYKRYALFKSHEVKSSLFGNIEVIILDNSTGWFD